MRRSTRWSLALWAITSLACLTPATIAGCSGQQSAGQRTDAVDAGLTDASSDTGIQVMDFLDWLSDFSRWHEVQDPQPDNNRFTLLEADPAGIALEALKWQPCGVGCSRADPKMGSAFASKGAISIETGRDGGPRPVLAISHGVPLGGEVQREARRIVDLVSGVTLAGLQVTAPHPGVPQRICYVGSSPSAFVANAGGQAGSEDHSRKVVGRLVPGTWTWSWHLPWFYELEYYCSVQNWPQRERLLLACANSTRSWSTGTDSAEEVVSDSHGSPYAQGDGEHLAWAHVNSNIEFPSVVSVLDLSRRAFGEVELPAAVCTFSVNVFKAQVAWARVERISGERDLAPCSGVYDGLRVETARVLPDGTLAARRSGPLFGARVSSKPKGFTSNEKYAVVMVEYNAHIVVRLADWRARRIRASPQRQFLSSLGFELHGDTFYYVENPLGTMKSPDPVLDVFRIDLTHLEEIGEPVEVVGD